MLIIFKNVKKTLQKNREEGIRTPGGIAPTQPFQDCTLSHSDTSLCYNYCFLFFIISNFIFNSSNPFTNLSGIELNSILSFENLQRNLFCFIKSYTSLYKNGLCRLAFAGIITFILCIICLPLTNSPKVISYTLLLCSY